MTTGKSWLRGLARLAPLALLAFAGGAPASAVDGVAEQAMRAGHFERALEAWNQASSDAPDAAARARADLGRGSAYLALGRYGQAVAALESALALAEPGPDPVLTMRVQAALGNAHLYAGRVQKGRELLFAASEAARAAGEVELAAAASGDIAASLASEGRFEDASALYRRSVDEAEHAGRPELAARMRINLARALTQAGHAAAAAPWLEEAQAALQMLPPSHPQAYGLVSIGRLLGDDPRAGTAFRAAAASARAIEDPRALTYALGYEGELYQRAGRQADALELTRRALRAAQSIEAPDVEYRWHWQAGRALRALGRPAEAIEAYQRAVFGLQSIRQDLVAGYGTSRRSFREQVGPVFLELADLMLHRASGITDEPMREALLREVRETLEQLKGAELADYFQDDCVAELKSRTAGIDALAARTAAVYPIILPDRLEILVSSPQGIRQFTVPVTGPELSEEIGLLRRHLERRITNRFLTHAGRLHDWLIRPIAAELERQQIETLVLVPDGPLRTIPLAALHDGKDFLIRNYALATTPGLTLTDPRPIGRGRVQLLLTGLTESVQGFPPLPNVADELSSIEKMFRGTVLRDRAFSLAAIESELVERPYSIVHIASHGEFRTQVGDSFLLTYDTKLSMDGLERIVGASGEHKQPVELLTLSACQTASGDDRAALGLAGVAIKAGARSALATLWYIDDQASSQLVAEFYRQLKDPGVSKAQALQRAQIATLEHRPYRHPSFWSPFLMIGNWL